MFDSISRTITLPHDDKGYVGRECPNPECLGTFNVTPGTGIKGEIPCHCPYCGQTDDHSKFCTPDQIEYLRSIVAREATTILLEKFKKLETQIRPSSGPLRLIWKVTGEPHPIYFYREPQLETEIVCDVCTLKYAIYGLFGFCPDCGIHNSFQILNKNLEVVEKILNLAQGTGIDQELAQHLIGDALENAVSAFDGFGREICRVNASKATSSSKAENVPFQNLANAQRNVQALFDFDFSVTIYKNDWDFACKCFQKRHLLAHKSGVVDDSYLKATGDSKAVIGHKVSIEPGEVYTLVGILRVLGTTLFRKIHRSPLSNA